MESPLMELKFSHFLKNLRAKPKSKPMFLIFLRQCGDFSPPKYIKCRKQNLSGPYQILKFINRIIFNHLNLT